MRAFLLRRLLMTALLLFLVALTVFLLGHLTGDPVRLMVPEDATAQEIAAFRRELGLDRPLAVQFADFLAHAVRGDLGRSLRYRQPSLTLVLERMPATIELGTAAMLIALAVAVPAGLLAAPRPGSLLDALLSTAARSDRLCRHSESGSC
jgi:peptide/nickel transport system permease protein